MIPIKVGSIGEDICEVCGMTIFWTGKFWIHARENPGVKGDKGHIAEPKEKECTR